MSERKNAQQFDQTVLDLYDDYAHGRLDRRDYVKRLAAFAVGGITVEGLINGLSPNYAWAEQVKPDDPRIKTEMITYPSPQGAGEMRGLLARPAKQGEMFPAVLVIHENRGLNPYIEDVARRLAVDVGYAFTCRRAGHRSGRCDRTARDGADARRR